MGVRILLFDDHPIVGHGLRTLLQAVSAGTIRPSLCAVPRGGDSCR